MHSLNEDKPAQKTESSSSNNATADDNIMVAFEEEGVISGWNSGVDESGPFFYDTPGAINNNMVYQ